MRVRFTPIRKIRSYFLYLAWLCRKHANKNNCRLSCSMVSDHRLLQNEQTHVGVFRTPYCTKQDNVWSVGLFRTEPR